MTDPEPAGRSYAGLVTRAVALLIDALMIDAAAVVAGGAVTLVLSVFGAAGRIGTVAAFAGGFAWLLWSGIYFVTFWTLTGQTPGDRLLGIRVVGPGDRVRVGAAVRRFAGLVASTIPLGLGFLPVLFDERRRGLHDRVAGTVVLWDDRSRAVKPRPAAPRSTAWRSS